MATLKTDIASDLSVIFGNNAAIVLSFRYHTTQLTSAFRCTRTLGGLGDIFWKYFSSGFLCSPRFFVHFRVYEVFFFLSIK